MQDTGVPHSDPYSPPTPPSPRILLVAPLMTSPALILQGSPVTFLAI